MLQLLNHLAQLRIKLAVLPYKTYYLFHFALYIIFQLVLNRFTIGEHKRHFELPKQTILFAFWCILGSIIH